ncbi:Gfo/Idh/MocA family protein [Nakamurella deserti]|uniref:Gfo/Idh/MocA family protein n=1 Tax=Nakamurella deserti TaxID=2164074 RepID=UPI000DBE1357|nr:Gfo/Idh/MocA family oxidoreductase [Nakamurella deserti]
MTRALPASRVPDPRSAPSLRWGIIGTGWIAERFVAALQASTTQQVVAVASRGLDRATAFAERMGIPAAFGSYQDLVAADTVDVVYVATEHVAHLDCARTAMRAGKPVLVEKPLAINADQARELAALADAHNVFCMEAFWTTALPKFDVIRQILDTGMLGELQTVMADNGEDLTGHRRVMDPAQAGGPMLDLGTYVFGLAHWVLGPQRLVGAKGTDHPSGINGQLSAILADDAGRQSVLHTSVLGNTPVTAFVAGSAATLVFTDPFYRPGSFEVRFVDGEVLRYEEAAGAHEALFWQACEVARCVAAGRLESPVRPLAASIATLEQMDEVRAALGIRFPGE